MKLKKIASLMLAGVMTVSMLAGCSTTSNNDGSNNDGEGEGTTATGYSVQLGDVLKKDAKAIFDKDYINFADNAEDETALKDALGNLGAVITGGYTVTPSVTPIDSRNGTLTSVNQVAADFADKVDLQGTFGSLAFNADLKCNTIQKAGAIYVVDGTVDMSKVVNQVADLVEKSVTSAGLAENGSTSTNTYDYTYTVSMSVANKAVTVIDGYNGTANFIAVTITRVPSSDVQ